MKKVLIVASTRIHIINFHLPYIQRFRELGWEVTVACGNCSEEIPDADRCIDLPFEKRMSSPSNFYVSHMLRKEIKRNKYDLLLCHTSLAAFFARLAVFGLKKRPAVCNMVHGYLFDDDSSWLKKAVLTAAEKLTMPVTELILTMNAYDKEYAESHKLAKRIENINGIGLNCHRETCPAEIKKELGIANDSFLLMYAAEFSKRKSHSVLIKAMTMLPENVVLLLPGKGDLLEEAKLLAKELNVADRVLFPGYVKNVGSWYASVDAAVSSSRSEGLPFNILEAMHYGLPVVASAVKGHTDLIIDGESGLLYPYGDSEACADRILQILNEPEYGKALATAAGKKVREYYLENVLPGVMELYLSALK